MFNNVFGLLHLIIGYSLILGALLYKPLKILLVFYDECFLLSWIAFKNECLVSYITKKYNKSNYKLGDHNVKSDITLSNQIYIFIYILKLYFYFTMSTWYYTIILAILLLLYFPFKNMKIPYLWTSPWRYVLLPIVLWLYHGYNAPFDLFGEKKHTKILKFGIITIVLFLALVLSMYSKSKDLYLPMIVSFVSLMTFYKLV